MSKLWVGYVSLGFFSLEPLDFNIFPYDSMTFEKGKKQQKGGLWIRYVKPHCAERGEIRLQSCGGVFQ